MNHMQESSWIDLNVISSAGAIAAALVRVEPPNCQSLDGPVK